jgi:hypothetical protein
MGYYIENDSSMGGEFTTKDKLTIFLPHEFLQSATINDSAEILYLYYTTCTIKISGYRLTKIYFDATWKKIGKVIALNSTNKEYSITELEKSGKPYIMNIQVLPYTAIGEKILS